MKRAIIYGRKSSTKQSVETIETQIAECTKWAKDNDCIVVDIYDDSQSGRDYNVYKRDGFNQIKEDAKHGRMDFALIHKIDRFARSVADYFIQERALNEYGVKVVVVGMPWFQNADIVTKSVHIAMAEQFSVNLSNEVSVKMRTHAMKTFFMGGKPPYGFSTAVINGGHKVLIPHPEHSKAIQTIYSLYLQGNGYVNISKALAQQGFFNAKNEPFTHSHIRKVLTSKKYNGWYVYGMRHKVNGKDCKNPDKSTIIEIPNVYDKIIDDETFNAVQDKINANVPRNKTRRRFYPLTGKIICQNCGRSVTGFSTSHQDRKDSPCFSYYRCTGKKVNGCDMKSISAEFLEDFVFEKIRKYVFDDTFIAKLTKSVMDNLSFDMAHLQRTKAEIEKALKENKEQTKAAMKDSHSKKVSSDLYEEIIEEYAEERKQLEDRLFEISQKLNANDRTESIKKYMAELKRTLSNTDTDVKQAVLKQVVRSVSLGHESVEVFLSLEKSKIRLSKSNHGVPLNSLDKQSKIHNVDGVHFLKISETRKKQG